MNEWMNEHKTNEWMSEWKEANENSQDKIYHRKIRKENDNHIPTLRNRNFFRRLIGSFEVRLLQKHTMEKNLDQ